MSLKLSKSLVREAGMAMMNRVKNRENDFYCFIFNAMIFTCAHFFSKTCAKMTLISILDDFKPCSTYSLLSGKGGGFAKAGIF